MTKVLPGYGKGKRGSFDLKKPGGHPHMQPPNRGVPTFISDLYAWESAKFRAKSREEK